MTSGDRDVLEELRSETREAAQLLGLLAFLAPEPVPLWLFAEEHQVLPDPLAAAAAAGRTSLAPAVEALEARELVSVEDGGLLLAPDRASRLRQRMSASERGAYGATVVRLLHAAFPDQVGRPEDRGRCEALAPHLLEAARWPGAGGRATAAAVHGLARLGSYFREEGRPGEAEEAFVAALEVAERGSPVEAPLRAVLWDELASAQVALDRREEALRSAEEALTLARESLADDAPQLPVLLSNVGTTLREAGEPDGAARCFQEAVARVASAPARPARRMLAELLLRLADVRMLQERFTAASEAAGRSLDVGEEVWGEVHPHVARAAWMLADARRALDETERATELYRRSLEIEERLHGVDHPAVGQKRMALGLHLEELGRTDEAARYYESALSVFRDSLGPDAEAVRSVRACLERVADVG